MVRKTKNAKCESALLDKKKLHKTLKPRHHKICYKNISNYTALVLVLGCKRMGVRFPLCPFKEVLRREIQGLKV
jgi:hypothetical protein